ncbi:ribonuclease P protein component 1 [Thermoproteota archaeon]
MSVSNIMFHEFIGKKVTIVESSINNMIGLSGEVVDETKYTLKIKTNEGIKIIVKSIVTLSMEIFDGTKVQIEGRKISYRSEDRIGRIGRKQ